VHETGSFNNVHIFDEIIRAAKKRDGLVAIQLVIAKAFDTVPHMVIDAALQRLGLPKFARDSITKSYANVSTKIHHNGELTLIRLQRGVKQGGPSVPFHIQCDHGSPVRAA
jgi:hypothetical protein